MSILKREQRRFSRATSFLTRDFRGVYSTILEDWMKLDAPSVVNGTFERPAFINTNGNGH